MERRKQVPEGQPQGLKPTSLPPDFLKMVGEIFTTTFDDALVALNKRGILTHFTASGDLYTDEVVVGVSMIYDGRLAATTGYASADFDPQASSPTLEELLSSCVDALGGVFQILIDPKDGEKLEALAGDSLGVLEDAPFQWTPMDINQRTIHVRVDKSNPVMDRATDDWLAANDPLHGKQEENETEDAEALAEERIDALLEEKAGIRRRTH